MPWPVHPVSMFGRISPGDIEYLIIAGGGGGGSSSLSNGGGGGGGGGGGYLSSISGETSGSNSSLLPVIGLAYSTSYSLQVGAGGAQNANGSASIFHTTTATGGGKGGFSPGSTGTGGNGGCGGGGGSLANGTLNRTENSRGTGILGQGFNGGDGWDDNGGESRCAGGGGGGAGSAGGQASQNTAGTRGLGISSSVTGISISRALGGTGGRQGSGTGTAGSANYGNGGNGGLVSGGAGGSGTIFLRTKLGITATFSGGVAKTTSTVGTQIVHIVTAAGASDTVTFS